MYSVGDFALNNYKLAIAFSDRLIPPAGQTYRKVLMADPHNIWKNSGKQDEVCYLLQSEQPHWPNYCRNLVSGPGGGNLVVLDGDYWLVFHGYRPDDEVRGPQNRYVWMLPLKVNIDNRVPMPDWIQPKLAVPAIRQ